MPTKPPKFLASAPRSPRVPRVRRVSKQPWARWYSTQRWRRIAKAQLDAEPLCRGCKRDSLVVKATCADHVVPHRGDAGAFWNGELQSLCGRCHLRKLNHEQYERRTGRAYQRRPAIGLSGWPIEER